MCFVKLVAAILLLAVAIYFLPWWSWLIILPAGAIALWLARERIFAALFTIPFRMKGKVLHKAAAEVHAVRLIPKPAVVYESLEDEGDPSDDDTSEVGESPEVIDTRRYFEVEVTITPKSPTGAFRLWEPDDIQLFHPRAHPMDDSPDASEVIDVKIHPPTGLSTEEAAQFEENSKFSGPLRLTLTVAVAPDVRAARFHYYFHKFGRIEFPDE